MHVLLDHGGILWKTKKRTTTPQKALDILSGFSEIKKGSKNWTNKETNWKRKQNCYPFLHFFLHLINFWNMNTNKFLVNTSTWLKSNTMKFNTHVYHNKNYRKFIKEGVNTPVFSGMLVSCSRCNLLDALRKWLKYKFELKGRPSYLPLMVLQAPAVLVIHPVLSLHLPFLVGLINVHFPLLVHEWVYQLGSHSQWLLFWWLWLYQLKDTIYKNFLQLTATGIT